MNHLLGIDYSSIAGVRLHHLKIIQSFILLISLLPISSNAAEFGAFTFKFAPYYIKDINGKATGTAMDFYSKLLEKMDLPKQKVIPIPGKRLQGLMEEKKNFIIFPLVYKLEREKFADFLYHTHSSTINFIGYDKTILPDYFQTKLLTNIPKEIKIGVLRGSIFNLLLNDKGVPEHNIQAIDNTVQNFSLLFNGRIDYILSSPGVTKGFFSEQPKFKAYEAKTKVLIPAVKTSDIYVAVNKTFDPDLRKKIYGIIDQLHKEGYFAELFGAYGYIVDGPRAHLK